jgi:uncharacterized membrane protein
MNRGIDDALARRERLVAGLLWYDTWVAVSFVGAGLSMSLLGSDGLLLLEAGIALFILLPAMRVALLAALFLRERDYTYAAITGLVLAILLASAVVAL